MSSENKDRPTLITTGRVAKTFQSISLSEEAKNLLTRMGGRIRVIFDPEAMRPLVSIVDERGRPLIMVSEFEKLATYRRFLTEAVKSAERENRQDLKLGKIAKLRALAQAADGIAIPTKILESNGSKQVELDMNLQTLMLNVEKLKNLPIDDYRGYLLDSAKVLESLLVYELIHTMGSVPVNKEFRSSQLTAYAIPHWLYGKLISSEFIRAEVTNSRELLFPRNNFLRGISFTTKEILDSDFIAVNHVPAKFSAGTFALASSNLARMVSVDHVDANVSEQLRKVFDEFPWVLHYGDTSEVLKPRIEGKSIPSISLVKPPRNREGEKNTRREGELPRLRRDLVNHLTKLSHTWELLTRGVITVEHQLSQFWNVLIPGAADWELTAAVNLYQKVSETDAGRTIFGQIVELSDASVRTLLAQALLARMEVFETDSKTVFIATMEAITSCEVVERLGVSRGALPTSHLKEDLDTVSTVSAKEKKEALSFLTLRAKNAKKKVMRTNAVILSSKTKNYLKRLSACNNGGDLQAAVTAWISSSFTSANDTVREIAAELVLAAAMNEEVLEFNEGEDSDDWSDEDSVE